MTSDVQHGSQRNERRGDGPPETDLLRTTAVAG
jgi:hypothetical protein